MLKIIKLTQDEKAYTAFFVAVNAVNIDFDNEDFKETIVYGSCLETITKRLKQILPHEKPLNVSKDIDYIGSVRSYLEQNHYDKICFSSASFFSKKEMRKMIK